MDAQPPPTYKPGIPERLFTWGLMGVSRVVNFGGSCKAISDLSAEVLGELSTNSPSVSAEKVSKLAYEVSRPVWNLWVAAAAIAVGSFYTCRTFSIIPPVGIGLFVVSFITGVVTWDLTVVYVQICLISAEFNKMHLESHEAKVSVEQIAKVVDGYSRYALILTLIFRKCEKMEASLTSWRAHLEEQVTNHKASEKKDSFEIAKKYLPILGVLIAAPAPATSTPEEEPKKD
ncbi:MAG: hypothetical protein KDK71_06525 [Chlamydiia bacterium]|nr:hypothetical protein [Chlamydiia bacterium]